MSFSLQKLTEGIRDRHVGQQNKRLVEKWSRTGLLRGMEEVNRENMATLLENQAAQVLRESNTMGSDAVGGFTNIAFPIVRRVFGGLVANELVSIQPMSLPSGLLFYLDYTYGSDNGPYSQGDSIYGSPTGKDIQGGADAVGGQYDLVGSGFSRTRALSTKSLDDGATDSLVADGYYGTDGTWGVGSISSDDIGEKDKQLLQFDPQLLDLIESGTRVSFAVVNLTSVGVTGDDRSMFKDAALLGRKLLAANANEPPTLQFIGTAGSSVAAVPSSVQNGSAFNVKRLNQLGTWSDATNTWTADAINGTHLLTVVLRKAISLVAANLVDLDQDGVTTDDAGIAAVAAAADGDIDDLSRAALDISFVKGDNVAFGTDGMVDGTPAFESNMAAGTPSPVIPEIDIKIESIPVTAQTRKLRARWSPELAQDLNAYHSMDAEVELTQILSEQIALEIDREILNDLLVGAKGANFFWSRSPGKFVNKRTGAEVARTSTLNPGPAFTGTVREWYETLTETVIDVANEIHRKTLRGSANFIVVSPDVATILEASVLYRPSYSLDGDGQVGAPFTMGAEKVGTLSNRFTVYKDPYFPRNKILVGYKGGSYLETGFVYAPYVPLIVTPTIFQPEDFTPRKGVMTRYGKKMVRADFYGTVTCLDMNII